MAGNVAEEGGNRKGKDHGDYDKQVARLLVKKKDLVGRWTNGEFL